MDEGSPVDIIYLDFQKAFDKVPHQRLILKLKSHGMGNSIINWIEQWLTDRRQRVVVDGEVSSWKSVLSGVPQGSVLGPILFLVYIDDLEEGVTGNILKFADDTKLFRKTKEIGDKQKLQDDIDKLVRWSEKWQMLFNVGKCKCLHTGPGNTYCHFYVVSKYDDIRLHVAQSYSSSAYGPFSLISSFTLSHHPLSNIIPHSVPPSCLLITCS